ncbi:hypothetical protein [Bradyrhizobium sp. B120]|uniref:hypothetical protein n=1 Tax=Bradyrhizobium sp. B120 TaxID=3410088 RepID=UPI003B97F075
MLAPLTTQIVGSYAKPEWLVNRDKSFNLDGSAWRIAPPHLDAARRDAALLAIYEQERAGLDLLTDGEALRPAYDRYFYSRLKGVDADTLGIRKTNNEEAVSPPRRDRAEQLERVRSEVPRIVGPVEWPGPLSVDELIFAKRHTKKPVKVTVIGPLTSYAKMIDDYYHDEEKAISALADALNAELRALDSAGADLLQIDEPSLTSSFSRCRRFGAAAIERVTAGLRAPVAIHVCYGYAYFHETKTPNESYADVLQLIASCARVDAISIEYEQPGHQPDLLRHCGAKHVILGLLNLGTEAVETPEHIARRLDAAARVVPPDRLHPASDCGMWHLAREAAFGKISSLVKGTEIFRQKHRI